MSASYPVINKVSCAPEVSVRFRTFNTTDSQTYRGRILGCVNFDVACSFDNVVAIHNNMKPSIAKREPAQETYLLIETADKAKRPFAVCWIDEETFEQTDAAADATVVLHNVTQSELFKILTTIRDLGFDVTQKTA